MLGNQVTVFGATGYVGREVVNELSKAGYQVTVVVRRPERFREFALYPNTKLFTLDSFDDSAQLKASMKNSQIVFNLLVDRSTGTEMIEKDELGDVARKLKSAMESDHIQRVMSLSFLGANNDCDSHEWLGVLGECDNQMHGVACADETIFRVGLLIGANDEVTSKYVNQLNRMSVLPVVNGSISVQPLWVKDFAKAMVASIENTALFGKKIEVAGTEDLMVKELGSMIASLMGKEDAVIFPMCKLNAKLMTLFGPLAPVASIAKSQFTLLQNDATTATDFAETFGFQPSSLEKVLTQYAVPKVQRKKYNDFRKVANR